MTYLVEIEEPTESKPLIEHLRTLKYVRMKKADHKSEAAEIIKAIRKSERSGKIKWSDAKRKIASWK
ncbi:MAG: hypothetical protein SH857_05180 [Chitinophagales bacterium]|nr:hypothetical protein [Chitinophagales bacterium]